MLAVADGQTGNTQSETDHRISCRFPVFEITTRKYHTLLDKELEKQEVQEGLIKACDVIDLIIEILRGSKNREQVKEMSGRRHYRGHQV